MVHSESGATASQELTLLSPPIFSIGQTSKSPRSSWKKRARDKGKELYGRSRDPHDVVNGESREREHLVFRLGAMETGPKVSPQSP